MWGRSNKLSNPLWDDLQCKILKELLRNGARKAVSQHILTWALEPGGGGGLGGCSSPPAFAKFFQNLPFLPQILAFLCLQLPHVPVSPPPPGQPPHFQILFAVASKFFVTGVKDLSTGVKYMDSKEVFGLFVLVSRIWVPVSSIWIPKRIFWFYSYRCQGSEYRCQVYGFQSGFLVLFVLGRGGGGNV